MAASLGAKCAAGSVWYLTSRPSGRLRRRLTPALAVSKQEVTHVCSLLQQSRNTHLWLGRRSATCQIDLRFPYSDRWGHHSNLGFRHWVSRCRRNEPLGLAHQILSGENTGQSAILRDTTGPLPQPLRDCVRVRAGSALLYPGPLWRGGRVEESPQDGRHGCRPVFRRYRDVPSKNPVTRPRTRSPWMGAGRAIGVSFPLGYFSFGQAKEK